MRGLVLCAVCLCSCVASVGPYLYTQTGKKLEVKPPNCEFEVISTAPAKPFEEVGVIEPEGLYMSAVKVADFRSLAQPHVCAAGADAAIAQVNGKGWYVKGIAIRYVSDSSSAK
jgi:hypothetical protein